MSIKDLNEERNLSKIIFISGGTKSGKSEFAEYLAKSYSNLTYVALSVENNDDKHWRKKISLHRKRRPKEWNTIETTNLIKVLKKERTPLLIDSIGGFIMENLNLKYKEWSKKMNLLIEELKIRDEITLIVGEQVGLGLVSEYAIGNRYI